MNLKQKISFVLISIILLSATALATPATDYTKAKATKAPVATFSASPKSGNAPLEVQFTDKSKYSPTSWKWSFGDGKYSTAKNPVHTYSKAGKYIVTLTVKNAAGENTKTIKDYISVNAGLTKPVADFSASPTSGDSPLEVQFTDKSTGTPTSWKWSFGDGKYSKDKNPVHTYNKAGKYTVTLTVKNAGGTDKIKKYNYITVYTEATPDKEAPVINSVSLSSTAPKTGDSITVTVDVTDNVGVSSVTASGISLANIGGNIWEGSIVAEEGTHTISVTASDAAGNSVVDESASYTATTPDTSTAVDPVCHMTVNKSTAKYTSVYNGITYYFCSSNCKAKFDANPEYYINS